MDNNDTKYYIVSLDNGIHSEEPITIKVFNNFQDGSQLVQLNETVFGVYKSHGTDPSLSYVDDYDIIKSDIAELFDISHENNRRIITDEKNVGIFTELNYSQNIETRISITNILQSIINSINNGDIPQEKALFYNKVLNYPYISKNNAIEDEELIKDVIELGIRAILDKLYLERKIPLDIDTEKAIKKSYIRMILFDYIIERKYRSYDYSIITNLNTNNKPTWEKVYFAPISVSNSIEKNALVNDNEYVLNNKYISRDKIISTLYRYYYEEIKKLTETISDAKKLYDDAIIRIIYNNTNVDKAKDLEDRINKNLKTIIEVQKVKEEKEYKEKKLNKVERTMATQSINVKITNKLDLIQKMYPINPKEHPELLNVTNTKEADEKVKLIVEEEKNNKTGFTSSIILTSIVALICGIGTGIAAILLILGN